MTSLLLIWKLTTEDAFHEDWPIAVGRIATTVEREADPKEAFL
jgi:hypothetical protein